MRGPGPAAGAPVAVAPLPSRGLPRCVQFSVAIDMSFITDCPQFRRSTHFRRSKSVCRRGLSLPLCAREGTVWIATKQSHSRAPA